MTNDPAKTNEQEAWGLETRLVHGGSMRSQFAETSEALFLTQSYVYASAEQAEERFRSEVGFIYSRYANPTVAMFEERMRLLEGAQAARATATGMAAVASALLCYLKAGDHVVAARALFGSCRYVVENLCPRFGIASTLVDGRDIGQWQRAMRPNTKAVFFETPANPTLDLVDIAAVSEVAHAAGAIVVVDNVFATPILQKPLKHGADINTRWSSHEPASILHELVFHANYESMQFLIDRGIDMTIRDYRWNGTAQGWALYAAKDEKMAQWLGDAERRRGMGR